MGNLMLYSGIATKIRVMQSKLLKEQDFEEIAGFKSVLEVIEYLKGKPAYAEYINQLDIAHYHRGSVEKVLYQSLFDDYSRIFRFGQIRQKRFLQLYWRRYETDLINYCLRIVFNRYKVPFDLEYKKRFFDRYSDIAIDRLIMSNNVDELVDNLRGTEYYEVLNRIKDSGAATLLDYDLALEFYYFSTVWKKERRLLDGQEKEMFLKEFGTKTDLLNLQWIYRAKKYYNMPPREIYTLTLPYHYRIKADEFKELVEAPSLEDFERKAEGTYYAEKYQMKEAGMAEQKYKAILKRLYLIARRQDPYSIATVNAYLFLKEDEIDKLTTALECIRYGLPRGDTLGYLGGVAK